MRRLGADTVLVYSSVFPLALDDDLAAEQLSGLADLAQEFGIRVVYEELAWGRHISTYDHAWHVVESAGYPALATCLDTFHILSRGSNPKGSEDIPGEKIFFLQLADALLRAMDVLQGSRRYHCFPGQGGFDIAGMLRHVLRIGYDSPSLKVFNDVFRQAEAAPTALDAHRSVLALQEGRRDHPTAAAGCPVGHRLRRTGHPDAQPVATVLGALGFTRTARHRGKLVGLWKQGEARILVNTGTAARPRERRARRNRPGATRPAPSGRRGGEGSVGPASGCGAARAAPGRSRDSCSVGGVVHGREEGQEYTTAVELYEQLRVGVVVRGDGCSCDGDDAVRETLRRVQAGFAEPHPVADRGSLAEVGEGDPRDVPSLVLYMRFDQLQVRLPLTAGPGQHVWGDAYRAARTGGRGDDVRLVAPAQDFQAHIVRPGSGGGRRMSAGCGHVVFPHGGAPAAGMPGWLSGCEGWNRVRWRVRGVRRHRTRRSGDRAQHGSEKFLMWRGAGLEPAEKVGQRPGRHKAVPAARAQPVRARWLRLQHRWQSEFVRAAQTCAVPVGLPAPVRARGNEPDEPVPFGVLDDRPAGVGALTGNVLNLIHEVHDGIGLRTGRGHHDVEEPAA
jgi:hypothetical protein